MLSRKVHNNTLGNTFVYWIDSTSKASTYLHSIEFVFPLFPCRLIRLLHKYGRENLLLANIYIKDPAVTMIRRDQKIPVIWFVANIGGILGLCMGCSLVTVFEVLHHIVLIFLKTSVKSVNRIHRTIRCVPESNNQVSSGVTLAALMQLGKKRDWFVLLNALCKKYYSHGQELSNTWIKSGSTWFLTSVF